MWQHSIWEFFIGIGVSDQSEIILKSRSCQRCHVVHFFFAKWVFFISTLNKIFLGSLIHFVKLKFSSNWHLRISIKKIYKNIIIICSPWFPLFFWALLKTKWQYKTTIPEHFRLIRVFLIRQNTLIFFGGFFFDSFYEKLWLIFLSIEFSFVNRGCMVFETEKKFILFC